LVLEASDVGSTRRRYQARSLWRIGDRNAWGSTELHARLGQASSKSWCNSQRMVHRVYLTAVELAFGTRVDYAMLVKMFGNDPRGEEVRYSPAECIGCRVIPIIGNPKARPSLLASQAPEPHHAHADAPVYAPNQCVFKKVDICGTRLHCTSCTTLLPVHQTLRVTPAMEAGVRTILDELRRWSAY